MPAKNLLSSSKDRPPPLQSRTDNACPLRSVVGNTCSPSLQPGCLSSPREACPRLFYRREPPLHLPPPPAKVKGPRLSWSVKVAHRSSLRNNLLTDADSASLPGRVISDHWGHRARPCNPSMPQILLRNEKLPSFSINDTKGVESRKGNQLLLG